MRSDMNRSERNAAYLDEMKKVTPSRATVEQAIARARARQASKKPKASPRNLTQPIVMKKKPSVLEPDPSTRSVDWQPEPSAAPKKPTSPTQEFFQNVFASRSTTSPTHGSRGRDFGHSSRMADPPTASDTPVDAPAPVIAATSQDEEREDGDTVSTAPRYARGKGEKSEIFQAEKFELESVAETKECDFGLEMRNLPNSPSMKSATENDDNWELKGMASEETLKATGNARRTRPHKGIFVRKGKKKKADDDDDGKVIRSLFSVDSSIAPVDALFDQESCFYDDDDEDDDFDEEVSEEEPRKADPPDSSPTEVMENDVDEAEGIAVAPKEEEEIEKDSETEKVEVPWDKKGTSLGHVEKLVASIKAKKEEKEEQTPSAEKTEEISSKDGATDSDPVKQGQENKESEISSKEGATDSDPVEQGEENEESEEYEDFVGDFLQSGSGDDAPQPADNVAETNGEPAEGIAGEAENDNLMVDEIEKCESQNAFLEQFEALGIAEESPRKKPIITKEGEEDDENPDESLDAIMEWRTESEVATESVIDSSTADAKPENETSPDEECPAEEDAVSMTKEIQQQESEQSIDGISNVTIEEQPIDKEAINGAPEQPEVETVDSTEDSVDEEDAKTEKESIAEGGVAKEATKGSLMDDDTVSNASEEDGSTKDSEEDEPKEEVPEEPIHIFKFAKGISEDDWQEKNEMASEWQYNSSSMNLDGVEAAENIHRFKNILNKEPEPRPWKVSHIQRTRNHPGFKSIDIYSVIESTEVTVSEKPHDDYVPWEHRDVKQLFLQERSVEFSRNWYGENHTHTVNSKFKLPVCRPRSMEMPLGTAEDTVEWNKDVYTTWKSPYQKVENQRLKLNKSEDDEDKSSDSESKVESQDVQRQSHLVKKSGSRDDNDENSQASEYDDEGSYSDGSYSDGSYTDSEGSYDSDDGSFSGSEISETGSALVIDDDKNTVASWEDAPECGHIVNMRLKIGEHVTRVHPAYTSSLRRSRWRKKYFPKGSFPY
mmetsp:Transcript_44927/g.108601  ORF Transcript_44927/g.108601 Transcript_44927/m.108601 type:complete len:1005 (-) Transcript_44927:73-3087(-)